MGIRFSRKQVQEKPVYKLVTKDHLDLAEWPFMLLKQTKDVSSILLELPNAKDGNWVWEVAGHPEFGLPNENDEAIYLALMYLASQENFRERRVTFCMTDLISLLGLQKGGSAYTAIENSLLRLSTVSISKVKVDKGDAKQNKRRIAFGIIDQFDISNSRGAISFFDLNRYFLESVQSGWVKSLDFGFYLSLNGYVARRLYRYLDKKAYDGKLKFEIGLSKLSERLGLGANYYPSQIKRLLEKAHEQLRQKEFIKSASFRTGKDDIIVCYIFGNKSIPTTSHIADKLIEHGLRPQVAMGLIQTYSQEPERVKQAIEWFESYQKKTKKKIQNTAGLLFYAVEEGMRIEVLKTGEKKSSSETVRLIPDIPEQYGREITDEEYSFLLSTIDSGVIEQKKSVIITLLKDRNKDVNSLETKAYVEQRMRWFVSQEGQKRGLIE